MNISENTKFELEYYAASKGIDLIISDKHVSYDILGHRIEPKTLDDIKLAVDYLSNKQNIVCSTIIVEL